MLNWISSDDGRYDWIFYALTTKGIVKGKLLPSEGLYWIELTLSTKPGSITELETIGPYETIAGAQNASEEKIAQFNSELEPK